VWHNYNLRPLKIMFAFKVATLITEGIGQRFWDCLLERNEAKVKAALPEIRGLPSPTGKIAANGRRLDS
jgi:hypothetical protein